MMKDQSVRDSVREVLENAQASGRQLPSIRAIRAKIGKGSLGTISEAVNEWKQAKLVQQGDLPSGFEQGESEKIVHAVWEVVAPMIRTQIEQIDNRAKARIQIEHDEASRVREAADEALASVEKKDRRLIELDEQARGLQEELAKLNGALEQANTENVRLAAENIQLHAALDKSLQEEAKALASLHEMKRLLPFLDPKHLDKVCVG
ncbi:MAG: DNA-binding protein [Duodenibacillus sp.]